MSCTWVTRSSPDVDIGRYAPLLPNHNSLKEFGDEGPTNSIRLPFPDKLLLLTSSPHLFFPLFGAPSRVNCDLCVYSSSLFSLAR